MPDDTTFVICSDTDLHCNIGELSAELSLDDVLQVGILLFG